MQGTGTYKWGGSDAQYTGDWRNNKKNGRGVMRYRDGGEYEGYWQDDKRHGQGKMKW